MDNLARKPEPEAPYGLKADGTPRLRANGWIKRREQLDVESHRKRIKVGMLMSKLMQAASGKLELSQTQVAACKILLDKAIPTLQAVETTTVETAVARSEPELLEALRALMTANPSLVQQILGEQASQTSSQPSLAAQGDVSTHQDVGTGQLRASDAT